MVLKEDKEFVINAKGQCSRGDKCSFRHDGHERAKPTPKTGPPSEPRNRGESAPNLQSRRCLFGHSAEEVAGGGLLVGGEAPRVDLGADVQGLRRVVQRLPGNIMWDRANPAARAVAKSVVEARPPEVARDETLTETVCASAADAIVGEPVGEARPPGIAHSRVEGSTGEAGSSCLGAEKTPSAGITAVAVLAGGVRSTGIAKQSAATKPELAECSGETRCATTESALEELPGEAGSSGSRAGGANSAAAAAVANSADEGRPPGFVKNSATTALLGVFPTVAGSAGDGEARLPEFAKECAATAVLLVVPAVAESVGDGETSASRVCEGQCRDRIHCRSDRAGPSWPRAKSTSSAGVTAASRPAGEARPPGTDKQGATTESDFAGSSDEARPPGTDKQGATTESDIAVSLW